MTVDYLIAVILAVVAVAFAVTAWKLWHGQWLRLIAGNTFATEEEMRLPYQRRMGRDVALLMVACALTFAFMACERLFGIERELYIAVIGGLGALVLAGSIIVSLRASRGAREAKAEIERMKPQKPTNAGKLGGQEAFLLVVVLGQFLIYGLIAVLVIFSH